MIAMALSCNPSVLIADEPTTALDVTIQAQILDLIRKLQKDMGTAVILITHDLGVVAEMCDDVAVMYAGKIVEYSDVNTIFRNPAHHYTKGLLGSVPHFESGKKQDRLTTIPGLVPNLLELKPGCRFKDRCTAAQPDCGQIEPSLKDMAVAHLVRCYHPAKSKSGMEART
jgi:oligopeptide/dipeptide ABC transporter ATP-binding protein